MNDKDEYLWRSKESGKEESKNESKEGRKESSKRKFLKNNCTIDNRVSKENLEKILIG